MHASARRAARFALLLPLLVVPLFVVSFALLLHAPVADASPLVVTLGSGPSSQSGDYINAIDLSHTLAFTNVSILADQTVRVDEAIDVSVSPIFGATFFDLFLEAPVRIEVAGDVRIGAGSIALLAPEVVLGGVLRGADGEALDQTRLASNATAFVVGAGGSVEQASRMAFENASQPVEIIVDGASDPNLVHVWSHVALELRSGFVENVTLQSAGAAFDWRGGAIGEAGLFGFGGLIRIHGGAFEQAPAAVCSSLPPSAWAPAPATLTNVGACLRGRLASGESFLVGVNFGGTIELVQSDPPTAVPGPGWLLAPALGLSAGRALRRRSSRRRRADDARAVDPASAIAP